MQGLIFLLISTLLLIKPTANGIFLAEFGVESLPGAYIMVAISAVAIIMIYNYFISQYNIFTILRYTLLISFLITILIGIFLKIGLARNIVVYIFYLFVALFGIVSASQFWIIANHIFNSREARKYFGFIGAGAIAGGIFGGYVASAFSSFTESENVLFIASFFLLATIPLLNKIKKYNLQEPVKASPLEEKLSDLILVPYRLISQSKHLKYMGAIIGVSVIVAKLIDYQFGYFATQTFASEEELTTFFGFWYSTFNIFSLVIQLFLTSKIVGKLGVGMSLFILPGILLINASILIFIPIIWISLSLKLVDGSFKQSINKAAIELLMLPVPEDIKLRTKTFMDVFVDSLATGMSGFLLLVLINFVHAPNFLISAVIVLLTIAWLIFAKNIRAEYKKIFRLSLKIQSESLPNIAKPHQETIISQYLTLFESGSVFQIKKALSLLAHFKSPEIEQSLLTLLSHQNKEIQIATMQRLTQYNHDHSNLVLPFILQDNQPLRVAAFEYLVSHQEGLDPNFLFQKISDSVPEIKLAALIACAKEYHNNPSVMKVLRISDRIAGLINNQGLIQNNAPIMIGILKTIGFGKLNEFYPFLVDSINSTNLKIKRQALISMGDTASAQFIPAILTQLEIDTVNNAAITGLSKFGTSQLADIIQNLDKEKKYSALAEVPKMLSLIPEQKSIDLLKQLCDHENFSVRNQTIFALADLKNRYPLLYVDDQFLNRTLLQEAHDYNYLISALYQQQKIIHSGEDQSLAFTKRKQLIGLLEARVDNYLKRIFSLLHIKYPPENLMELYQYVTGSDTSLRYNALEYLEGIISDQLRKVLLPLIEFNVVHSANLGTNKFPQNDLFLFNEAEVLIFLSRHSDPDIRKTAKELMNTLKLP